ncbi:ammonium transporter, partial [Haematococcus lacustris]
MGLAMFVAGTVRAKNISAILMKSAIDTCITAFIGTQDFALAEMTRAAPGHRLWHLWGWEWVFCATSATILAGAVAERGTFISYMIWTAIYSMWVYPVVGVVHTQGGFAALVAAALLGPRIGRFEAGANMRLYKGGHNSPLYLLGTFFMWLGWYGFNPGSNLAVHNFQEADVVARTA